MLAVAICFVIKTSQTIYSAQLEHSLPLAPLQARPQNQAKLTALPNNIYGQGKHTKNDLFSSFSGQLGQNKHIPCSFQCFISIPRVVIEFVLSELACISHTFQSRVCRRGGWGWGRRYESLAGAGQDWRVERDATALLAELPDHVLQRPALLRSADHIQRCWTRCTSNMRFQHNISWIIQNGRHLGSHMHIRKWHPKLSDVIFGLSPVPRLLGQIHTFWWVFLDWRVGLGIDTNFDIR